MDRVIVDTSVLIAHERDAKESSGLIRPGDDVAIAAVAAAELLVGVERATGQRRAERLAYVERVLASVSIVAYDLRVARVHARLLAHTLAAGIPRGANDLMIAATAAADERLVVTLDGRGFEGLPGVVLRDE